MRVQGRSRTIRGGEDIYKYRYPSARYCDLKTLLYSILEETLHRFSASGSPAKSDRGVIPGILEIRGKVDCRLISVIKLRYQGVERDSVCTPMIIGNGQGRGPLRQYRGSDMDLVRHWNVTYQQRRLRCLMLCQGHRVAGKDHAE